MISLREFAVKDMEVRFKADDTRGLNIDRDVRPCKPQIKEKERKREFLVRRIDELSDAARYLDINPLHFSRRADFNGNSGPLLALAGTF